VAKQNNVNVRGQAAINSEVVARLKKGDPVTVDVGEVSTEYFSIVGIPPMLGRTFAPGEDQQGGAKVVVLSHKLWTQRFGSDPTVVNQTIRMNDQGYTVIGVMPALELIPDVIVPIHARPQLQPVRLPPTGGRGFAEGLGQRAQRHRP